MTDLCNIEPTRTDRYERHRTIRNKCLADYVMSGGWRRCVMASGPAQFYPVTEQKNAFSGLVLG